MHHGSGDTLDSFILTTEGQLAVEIWTHPLDKEQIQTLRFPLYNPQLVQMDKYDHVTPILNTVLVSCDHHTHWLVMKKRCIDFTIRCGERGA